MPTIKKCGRSPWRAPASIFMSVDCARPVVVPYRLDAVHRVRHVPGPWTQASTPESTHHPWPRQSFRLAAENGPALRDLNSTEFHASTPALHCRRRRRRRRGRLGRRFLLLARNDAKQKCQCQDQSQESLHAVTSSLTACDLSYIATRFRLLRLLPLLYPLGSCCRFFYSRLIEDAKENHTLGGRPNGPTTILLLDTGLPRRPWRPRPLLVAGDRLPPAGRPRRRACATVSARIRFPACHCKASLASRSDFLPCGIAPESGDFPPCPWKNSLNPGAGSGRVPSHEVPSRYTRFQESSF